MCGPGKVRCDVGLKEFDVDVTLIWQRHNWHFNFISKKKNARHLSKNIYRPRVFSSDNILFDIFHVKHRFMSQLVPICLIAKHPEMLGTEMYHILKNLED